MWSGLVQQRSESAAAVLSLFFCETYKDAVTVVESTGDKCTVKFFQILLRHKCFNDIFLRVDWCSNPLRVAVEMQVGCLRSFTTLLTIQGALLRWLLHNCWPECKQWCSEYVSLPFIISKNKLRMEGVTECSSQIILCGHWCYSYFYITTRGLSKSRYFLSSRLSAIFPSAQCMMVYIV